MTDKFNITHIKHGDLHPNPYNRHSVAGHTRSGFDPKSLGELADSIREQGLIQPLIVRKVNGQAGYQIVAGERRWTASGIVNKKFDLPCIVRQLTEAQSREINTIENLQRVGLHPIEEAHGYQDLLDLDVTPRHTIESIAERVSKSVAFVYARLKLLRAPELAQQASFKGKLTHSNLLLIARIPDPKLAHQATLELLAPFTKEEKDALDPHVEPLSYRAAKKHIQDKYMVRLKDAPFDTKDETLVPVSWETVMPDGSRHVTTGTPQPGPGITINRLCGGACADCPCLTGNMKALFTDVDSSDVCTHTPCYKRKVAADFKARELKARDNGDVLLKDKTAAQLFYQGRLTGQDFVDLDAPFPGEKKKTWGDVLDKHLPDQLTQARDDKGKVHFLLPMVHVADAVKAAGRKLPKNALPADPEQTAEDRRQKEAERNRRIATAQRAEALALDQLRRKVAKLKPNAAFWRALTAELLDLQSHLLERHGIESPKDLTRFLKKRNEAELRALMVEAAFFYNNVDWDGQFTETFNAGCKQFGLNPKALLKQARAAADATPADFKKALDAVSPEAK